jgi:hypothetical protein
MPDSESKIIGADPIDPNAKWDKYIDVVSRAVVNHSCACRIGRLRFLQISKFVQHLLPVGLLRFPCRLVVAQR